MMGGQGHCLASAILVRTAPTAVPEILVRTIVPLGIPLTLQTTVSVKMGVPTPFTASAIWGRIALIVGLTR